MINNPVTARKLAACMAIAGTILAVGAGVAGAEPAGRGNIPTPSGPSTSGEHAHVVVTYDYNGYPEYNYVYTQTDPAPSADPATGNRLAPGGQDRTWAPVAHPDGSWTVCQPYAVQCK
ncbi:hypothetical protein [Nocardia sp. NPDC004722]